MSNESIHITLADVATGKSEAFSVNPQSMRVSGLMDLTVALLGCQDPIYLSKDGNALSNAKGFLSQVGVKNGDLIAVNAVQTQAPRLAAAANNNTATTTTADTAFDLAALVAATPSSGPPPKPVFKEGMSLADAIRNNPHPEPLMKLLLSKDRLFKELKYHQPALASKLKTTKSTKEAVLIWRNELAKGSVRRAVINSTKARTEAAMALRLTTNPDDKLATTYFKKKENKMLIEMQYEQMMDNNPESMGRILMLYIDTKVNGISVPAFVDSGAQTTVMTQQCAKACGIAHLIDTRFEGLAVGVGSTKILGRVHLADMQIGTHRFPISVTVMEKMTQGNDMKFLLGLDNLKRYTCQLDLAKNELRFNLGNKRWMSTPFLHEKDLPADKGGTRGLKKKLEMQQKSKVRK